MQSSTRVANISMADSGEPDVISLRARRKRGSVVIGTGLEVMFVLEGRIVSCQRNAKIQKKFIYFPTEVPTDLLVDILHH